jgi:hypothetical protein
MIRLPRPKTGAKYKRLRRQALLGEKSVPHVGAPRLEQSVPHACTPGIGPGAKPFDALRLLRAG